MLSTRLADPATVWVVGAIEVSGLVKDYGPTRAVDGISFSVEPGEVYALLGPNGAGKSTTVEVLAGQRSATQGQVQVLGTAPSAGEREWRDRIGIVWQSAGVEPELNVREALDLYRGMYRTPLPTSTAAAMAGLEGELDRRVATLSGGQQRRLDLALGVIGNPDVLFLDEPTTGFDPSARRRAWGILDDMRQLGTTILLTTHYLDEAAQLADRVGILVDGKLVAEGPPNDLDLGRGQATRLRFDVHPDVGLADLALDPAEEDLERNGSTVSIYTTSPTKSAFRVSRWALSQGLELDGLTIDRPSLEDLYLDLIADGDRD